jgi:hypothetical protein
MVQYYLEYRFNDNIFLPEDVCMTVWWWTVCMY